MQQSQHSWNERMVVAQTSNHIGVYRNFMLMETSNGKIFIDIPRIKWWSGKEWPEGLLWTCTEMWQKPWPNPKCQNICLEESISWHKRANVHVKFVAEQYTLADHDGMLVWACSEFARVATTPSFLRGDHNTPRLPDFSSSVYLIYHE